MPTIKENLLALRAAIEAEPEGDFNLHQFVQHTPCGTLHCSAGLAATMPFFINQLSEDEQRQSLRWRAEDISDHKGMWGPDAFKRLFERHDEGTYDGLLTSNGDLTDKQLAIARIDLALEQENDPS